uniref:Uncharacterized protein n=1 Tax=Romanomermis culicivorax TaxID=13658 RepID=A0A915IJ67_ROMCU
MYSKSSYHKCLSKLFSKTASFTVFGFILKFVEAFCRIEDGITNSQGFSCLGPTQSWTKNEITDKATLFGTKRIFCLIFLDFDIPEHLKINLLKIYFLNKMYIFPVQIIYKMVKRPHLRKKRWRIDKEQKKIEKQ